MKLENIFINLGRVFSFIAHILILLACYNLAILIGNGTVNIEGGMLGVMAFTIVICWISSWAVLNLIIMPLEYVRLMKQYEELRKEERKFRELINKSTLLH